MKSVHSPSVVRLSPAPKRVVHQVVLTKHVTHLAKKSDTAVCVSPAPQVNSRHSVSKGSPWTTPPLAKRSHQMVSASLGMTLATGMLGKLATVLLVPMLFFQPLLPLFAADESVAPAEPTQESVPVVVDTPPPPEAQTEASPAEVVSIEPASDASTPAEETPPEELPQEEVVPALPDTSNEEGAVDVTEEVPEETVGGDTETIVPDEIVEEVLPAEGEVLAQEGLPAQAGEVAGEATTTPEAQEVISPESPVGGSGGGVQASETNAGVGIGPDGIVGEAATSTDEAALTEGAEVENVEDEAAAEEEAAPALETDMTQAARDAEAAQQAEAARQEAARLAMRKEIEAEITKGCLTIDNVGYYCLKNFEGTVSAGATTTKISSIQSLPDPVGGDKEIFITRDGVSTQLTYNTWDDTFPAMDVTGTSLVWQGTVEGRWQVFFADVSSTSSPVITQLTHSTESNFNPRVDGNTVVWQGWVGGNWEIFLADHLAPSSYYPDGEEDVLPSENRRLGINGEWHVARLSENETHDMFPAISGGLVTWQSFQEGSWNVYAYNMRTGVSTQLSQGGVKSENPRFAVTWDERDANGNMRMVGYDIASGKTIDLTDVARHTPGNQHPYQPDLPGSQSNQAALPPTSGSGTSTPARADGDDEGGLANGMDV